jgi:hypothetical protein
MTITKLKPEFYQQAESDLGVMSPLLYIINRALELQYEAEANEQQETYITAEQARELGAGNAEFNHPTMRDEWNVCAETCSYPNSIYGENYKYRAIRAQPDDSVIRVGDKVRIGVYVCGEFKPMSLAIVVEDVDAQLCRVDKMSLHGGAPWITLEQKSHLRKETQAQPEPVDEQLYCQVSKDGEPAKRMLRTDAQKLQAESGDTVDWFNPYNDKLTVASDFGLVGIYKYGTKANLVKLGGELMTREAAIAKYEAVQDKCDIWIKNDVTIVWEMTKLTRKFIVYANECNCEYELRTKPAKVVALNSLPFGSTVKDGVMCLAEGYVMEKAA